MDFIYLDNHATTPCDPRVVEAMLPFFGEAYGNPSSTHYGVGRQARDAVQRAREQVASLLGARPTEVVFTAGATEAINLALKGLADGLGELQGRRLITTAVEHDAVLETCAALKRRGADLVTLPVDGGGRVSVEAVDSALTPDTLAVAVMMANNELGTLQPVAEIGDLCGKMNVPFLSDLAQSLGKVPVDVDALCLDLGAMSAHKLYGPKGVGALYVRSGSLLARLRSQIHGASHEHGLRAGTLNVPGIVGFGAACALAEAEMAEEGPRTAALRDRLLRRLEEGLGDLPVNGDREHRLPQNLHIALPGVEAQALLEALPHVGMSAGSACTSSVTRVSRVLLALGLPEARALSSLRFGVGRHTTEAQVDEAARRIVEAALRLRR